jgi:hypothetical protein
MARTRLVVIQGGGCSPYFLAFLPREVYKMHVKILFAWMAGVGALLILLGTGFAAAEIVQPPQTPYMRSTVGTPDELSPLAPAAARKVCKVGNQWTCEINGQPMVYNEATSSWEPKQK